MAEREKFKKAPIVMNMALTQFIDHENAIEVNRCFGTLINNTKQKMF